MLLKRRYWLYYVLPFFEGSRKQVLNCAGAAAARMFLSTGNVALVLMAMGPTAAGSMTQPLLFRGVGLC